MTDKRIGELLHVFAVLTSRKDRPLSQLDSGAISV